RNYLEQDDISLRQAQIALEQAQLSYQRAQAASESSKVKLDTAQAEYDRNKELFEKQLVSRRTLEESETRHANAQYEYDTAEKNVQTQLQSVESQKQNIEAREEAIKSRKTTLNQHEQGLITIKESGAAREKEYRAGLEYARVGLQKLEETAKPEKDVRIQSEVSARADLLQAESALAAQKKRLDWTTVEAPISGTVTRVFFEEGEIVTSGRSAFSRGQALMTIADLSRMIVKTQINEVEISKVEVGQEADVRVETYTDRVFKGRVSEISPGAVLPQPGVQNTVITFEVEVEILEATSQLLPGMSADVDIIVFKGEDVLQLPIEAVINPEVLTVKATLTGRDLRRLRPNQELKIENLAGKEFPGKVGKIRTGAPRGNVEILLDGTPRGLRSGPTEVSILISETDRISGVQSEIAGTKQYYVQLDSQAKGSKRKKDKDKEMKGVKTRIEVGRRNDSHFEILAGVEAGSRVFVPSMEQLTRQDGK
ncbi:MAG: HlyD family efflux transporter periplasmic adaptor subunit, partial [Candidatus Poribacteria bacterium]|nr:HlyD family efflux transporter periplasmic adaptor subunit [Candidatus Poribacteria bacterium]